MGVNEMLRDEYPVLVPHKVSKLKPIDQGIGLRVIVKHNKRGMCKGSNAFEKMLQVFEFSWRVEVVVPITPQPIVPSSSIPPHHPKIC